MTAHVSSNIEITPEMIEAGAKVCAEVYGVCSEFVGEGLAEDIFKAMMDARTNPSVTDHAEKTRRNS
jgi:hypothetical protein